MATQEELEQGQRLLRQKRAASKKRLQQLARQRRTQPDSSSSSRRLGTELASQLFASKQGQLAERLKEMVVCQCGRKVFHLNDEGQCWICEAEKYERKKKLERVVETARQLRLDRDPLRRKMTFDNFQAETKEQQEALLACQAWANVIKNGKTMTRGLYLFGEYGIGKTHLAIAILIDLLKHGYHDLYYFNEPTVLKLLYDGMDDKSVARLGSQALGKAASAKILVLDDAGRSGQSGRNNGKTSSWYRDTVYMSFCEPRASFGLPVIVTSNKSPAELRQHIGGANFDRLSAVCATSKPIKVVGTSFRGR